MKSVLKKIKNLYPSLSFLILPFSPAADAGETTELIEKFKNYIDPITLTGAMLKNCSEDDLVLELDSSIKNYANYYAEAHQLSHTTIDQVLQHHKASSTYTVSRLEQSTNEEWCNNLIAVTRAKIEELGSLKAIINKQVDYNLR